MLLAAKANLVIAVPLVAVASLLSPLLMGLYGDAFADGWPTLVIALHTAGVIAVLMPITQMIVASGQMWVTLAMNAGWAVVFLAGSAFFTRYGSQGISRRKRNCLSVAGYLDICICLCSSLPTGGAVSCGECTLNWLDIFPLAYWRRTRAAGTHLLSQVLAWPALLLVIQLHSVGGKSRHGERVLRLGLGRVPQPLRAWVLHE